MWECICNTNEEKKVCRRLFFITCRYVHPHLLCKSHVGYRWLRVFFGVNLLQEKRPFVAEMSGCLPMVNKERVKQLHSAAVRPLTQHAIMQILYSCDCSSLKFGHNRRFCLNQGCFLIVQTEYGSGDSYSPLAVLQTFVQYTHPANSIDDYRYYLQKAIDEIA